MYRESYGALQASPGRLLREPAGWLAANTGHGAALGLVNQHVGDLHADHGALAQMRSDAVGMVAESKAAAHAAEIGGTLGQVQPQFGRDRFRVDRRQLFLGLRVLGSKGQLGVFEQSGEFARQIGTGLTVFGSGYLDATGMEFIGDREIVERNGRTRAGLVALYAVALVGGDEEVVEQRSEITLGAGSDVSLPLA